MPSEETVQKWKELFDSADTNGDGYLDLFELRDLMTRDGKCVSEKAITDTFVLLDGPRGDKQITWQEFRDGMEHMVDFFAKVKDLFSELDTDQSGDIDKEELRQLFVKCGRDYTEEQLDTYFTAADANMDGRITLDELIRIL